jgi:hypothetical protein
MEFEEVAEIVNVEQFEEVGQWVAIDNHPDYEIYNQYPFPIKRTNNNRLKSIWLDASTGYNICLLDNNDNRQKLYHHRLIALQFIPNPDNLPQVDHIDRNKQNNHIENLRWVSSRDNNRNRTSTHNVYYEFIEELPEDAITVEDYGTHQFTDLYYSHTLRRFIINNGVNLRLLHNNLNVNSYFVITQDTNENRVNIHLNRFQRLYNLI